MLYWHFLFHSNIGFPEDWINLIGLSSSPKDRRATVQKVWSQVNHHRQLCQFFKYLSGWKRNENMYIVSTWNMECTPYIPYVHCQIQTLLIIKVYKFTLSLCQSDRKYRSQSAKACDTFGSPAQRTWSHLWWMMMMMMAFRHIPTMTKSHHGGEMSVMIKVGMCQCQIPTIHDKFQLQQLVLVGCSTRPQC